MTRIVPKVDNLTLIRGGIKRKLDSLKHPFLEKAAVCKRVHPEPVQSHLSPVEFGLAGKEKTKCIAEPPSKSTLLTEEPTANRLIFPKSGSLHSPDPLKALPGF